MNTASLNGLMSFKTLGSLAHTTAKAGIIGMTRQLAMEGREHRIRANSISPGLTHVLTEEFRDSLSGAIERASIHLEELQKVADAKASGKTRAIAVGSMAD